ncbi:MAG: hypothetical protein ACTHLN_15480 [Tepidisphaeraceae bacterium]
MTKRSRYIGLSVFAVIGIVLAIGAWHPSPGQDPDNQGGYAIVLLLFVVLLFIYVPVGIRWLGSRLRRHGSTDPQPPDAP